MSTNTPTRGGASTVFSHASAPAVDPPQKPPAKLPTAPSHLETRALESLVGAWTSESLESPMYASCPKAIEFQAQARRLVSYIGSVQHPTCAYRADGGIQPLVWAFLRGVPASPWHDGDAATAVAVASRTCWILG
jgi:hypothetical protein